MEDLGPKTNKRKYSPEKDSIIPKRKSLKLNNPEEQQVITRSATINTRFTYNKKT